jgi:hypothetical protein
MKNDQLTGPIPSWMDTFTDMQLLDLGQSKLTGKIPDELGNMTGLDLLLLNRNQLTGSLPDSFTSCRILVSHCGEVKCWCDLAVLLSSCWCSCSSFVIQIGCCLTTTA